uniref:Lipoprotein n=1 Tax=Streptomyces sp. NBC_00049 TaxID=2903617 RepID=A0AAU2JVG9_9ACTN
MKLRLAAAVALPCLALTLTACNDGTADPSADSARNASTPASAPAAAPAGDVPAYDASKLEPGEKKFMDTVWAVSDNRASLKEADAQTIKSVVAVYGLECLGDDRDREQVVDKKDTGARMSPADREKLLTSWRLDLCGRPDKGAFVKDVALTRQGFQKNEFSGDQEYGVHWKITNSGAEAADYMAAIEFYDKDGDFLGSTAAFAERLGPGKSTDGDAAAYPEAIRNGSVADIVTAKVGEVDRLPKG